MLRKLLRITAWTGALLALLAALAYAYYLSLGIDRIPKANPHATVADLDYMRHAVPDQRGRILAVVSSTARMDGGKKKAGYELSELARAYYIFKANGFEVDIASPAGGTPPVRIDKDDMGESDYAFLNDKEAQARVRATLKLAQVDPAKYAAVYFVGGKGAMFDFPGHPEIARIVGEIGPRGVVGAVCHGPAALLGIKLKNGAALMAGRHMTGTSNAEELFFRKDARRIFPFLLEEKAREVGARFSQAPLFLANTVTDGRVVTGQNPWSTWSTAEAMIAALGYTPVARQATAEEISERILATYYRAGFARARAEQAAQPRFDKMLVLMHALVAGMQWRLADAFQLQRLANT
jgi:putative intracellular protease/amidase